MTSWVGGRAAHAIDCRDRGFQYGDGIFETMRVQRRAIRLLDYHLDRLEEGCRRLGFAAPNDRRLRQELNSVAAQRAEAVLKLIVTRGIGTRGYRPTGRERSTRVMSLHPLTPAARHAAATPTQVRLCRTRLGHNAALAGLKTLNRLESVLARAEWSDARTWEGLMRDTDDNIVCGTMTNLFVRRGLVLLTPVLDRCGVAGVMRRWVLEQATPMRLRATEGRLRWQDLERADEAFLTNAVVGVVPIAVIRAGRLQVRLKELSAATELRRRLELQ